MAIAKTGTKAAPVAPATSAAAPAPKRTSKATAAPKGAAAGPAAATGDAKAPAKVKGAPKQAAAAGKAPAAASTKQNGVALPTEGTLRAEIWALLDTLHKQGASMKPAAVCALLPTHNPVNVGCEITSWRKYHNRPARVGKVGAK